MLSDATYIAAGLSCLSAKSHEPNIGSTRTRANSSCFDVNESCTSIDASCFRFGALSKLRQDRQNRIRASCADGVATCFANEADPIKTDRPRMPSC